MTQEINNKMNGKETDINKEISNNKPSYEEEMEHALRNASDLFKQTLAVT